jgi:hypothetical protein
MKWPFVSRETFDCACRRYADEIAGLKEALAVERSRLTEALAAMSRLRLEGAKPEPEPVAPKERDPVEAAIHARAQQYPPRVRREIMRTMSQDAQKRLAAHENTASVIEVIMHGIPVEELPI